MATVSELIKALNEVPNQQAEVIVAVANVKTATGDFTGGAAEDMFTLAAHGLTTGDPIRVLSRSAAGTFTGTLEAEYFAKVLTSSTFQIATTSAATTLVENTADGTIQYAEPLAIDVSSASSAGIQGDGPNAATVDPGVVRVG